MSRIERTLLPTQIIREVETGRTANRFDLLSVPWLRTAIKSPWPLFFIRSITLAGFAFTILAGLIGSPVGSHNFAIIFVWIAWWTALKLFFIPLGGRSWCSVCPLPLPGEWLQHGGLITKAARVKRAAHNASDAEDGARSHKSRIRNTLPKPGLRWPKKLRGAWLPASLFLAIGMFSAVTLTDARITAWILLGLTGLATVLDGVFEKRTFCKHICPIGGFSGLYVRTSPVELRVKDIGVCTTHREKSCYQECPWGLYPVSFQDSSQCGLCMECLRACPRDNIALNVRPFGSDLGPNSSKGRLDETFLALVMLGSAISFAAVFSGSWGNLKNAAFSIGSLQWLAYIAGFLGLNLLILPAAYTLAVWLEYRGSSTSISLRHALAHRSQALIPLGLFAWIAFTISFALPKFSYVMNVLSDPLGWGWDLLGTASFTLPSDHAAFGSIIQVVFLLIGLGWSIDIYRRQTWAESSTAFTLRRVVPGAIFCIVYTNTLLWLLVG